MTVKELINELSKFNPGARLILDNNEDNLKVCFSWGGNDGECLEQDRNIEKEKKEAKYVTLELLKNKKDSRIKENY